MLNYKTNVFLSEDKPDSEGKVPVRFYINISGERITKHVGIRVRPKDWDSEKWQVRKSDHNYRNHNETIRTTLSEIEAKIQEAYNQRKKITPALVRQLLNGKAGTDDFWKYTEGLILDMEKKFSASHLVNFNGVLKRLKEFAPQFYFTDATPAWLRKYESYLRDGGLANNTIHKHFKLLKKIFNSAIREGVTENYPFRNYDNPKYIQTIRTFLTKEEIFIIENYVFNIENINIKTAGLYFLLGCFSGIRVSDQLKLSDKMIIGGKLITQATKNDEIISVPIHPKLEKVLTELKLLGYPYMAHHKINAYLKVIADVVGIKKNITNHVSRHSFAILCLEAGISSGAAAKKMGITKKTFEIYGKITDRQADREFEALKKL